MRLTPKIQRAINLAATLHDGQERKGDAIPYIVHPVSVALILMDYTEDEDIILAGILHDTIEDTNYTEVQMVEEFGGRVTGLVLDVTEANKNLPWQKRKDDYLAHLRTTGYKAKLICAADKLHNLQSMREAFYKFGEKAFEKFKAPVDKKLWFYEQCLEIFRAEEDMPSDLIEGIEEAISDIEDEERLLSDLFLGIVSRKINNHWDDSEIFLVNPTDKTFMVDQMQGSFDGSDEDNFMNLGHGDVGTFELPPKSFHQIDKMEDEGELDFTTWYRFRLKDKNEEAGEFRELMGETSGRQIIWGGERMVPIINKMGIASVLRE